MSEPTTRIPVRPPAAQVNAPPPPGFALLQAAARADAGKPSQSPRPHATASRTMVRAGRGRARRITGVLLLFPGRQPDDATRAMGAQAPEAAVRCPVTGREPLGREKGGDATRDMIHEHQCNVNCV